MKWMDWQQSCVLFGSFCRLSLTEPLLELDSSSLLSLILAASSLVQTCGGPLRWRGSARSRPMAAQPTSLILAVSSLVQPCDGHLRWLGSARSRPIAALVRWLLSRLPAEPTSLLYLILAASSLVVQH